MLELFFPSLAPTTPLQGDIAYGFKLLAIKDIGDSIADRLFKSKKTQLEEKLIERQLELLGDNPDTNNFNTAMLAARGAQELPRFIESISVVPAKKSGISVASFLKQTENIVDLPSFARQHRADMLRRAAKTLSKAK